MKITQVILPISFLILGAIGGWFSKGEVRVVSDAAEHKSLEQTKTEELPVGAAKPSLGANDSNRTTDDLLLLVQANIQSASQKLSDAEFAALLARSMVHTDSRSMLTRDALLAVCTPERFALVYDACVALRGDMGLSDGGMETALTSMGKKHGEQLLKSMLEKHPNGFRFIDNVLHGWAYKDSGASVEWFNSLPHDHKYRAISLQGLIWGLAEKDGQMAGKVWHTLDPEDRKQAAFGLSNAYIGSHGLAAFDGWVGLQDAQSRHELLRHAKSYASRRPLNEYVPWLATNSADLVDNRDLYKAFGSWAGSEPNEAGQWMTKHIASASPNPYEGERIKNLFFNGMSPEQLTNLQQSMNR